MAYCFADSFNTFGSRGFVGESSCASSDSTSALLSLTMDTVDAVSVFVSMRIMVIRIYSIIIHIIRSFSRSRLKMARA